MKFARLLALAGAGLAVASPAAAHLDPAAHGSVAAGFTHPLFGLDHVLAMVAVGLWAAMLGGRAVAAVPAAFVGAMVVGFGLAMAGLWLPFVEPMILASVVLIGLLVAIAARVPVAGGAAIVGVFALFHGFAHGGELGAAAPGGYLAGFVLGTALLHAVGIGLGLGLARLAGGAGSVGTLGRALGAGTAMLGLGLGAGVI
ncbi:HupE / UreJ protein [Roseivivax jejudonensis]|uniref:HupE / UreJ protein n=1 Tax=Roseivivax jejudonensis TaxID=1529041 RepID=A0A1X6ZXV2_9RHOB|nr:HupE/UreJ family protein [Roseivivax jejudonensis]SLN64385.1 HupE / UreJ protein [Roseivivax jejudonensis]